MRSSVERRRKFEPVAYIVGQREFYGLSFLVDARVLVPRPETELIIEAALELLPASASGRTLSVLDLGTGSGILAVTLAAKRTDVVVDAVDLSAPALEVTKANAERHGVSDRVRTLPGDLYGPIGEAKYPLIVSNPPYIPTRELAQLMPDVRDHEPRAALDGGVEGDAVIVRVIAEARRHLVEGGALVVEIGYDQGTRATQLAHAAGFADVRLRLDLARIERTLVAR